MVFELNIVSNSWSFRIGVFYVEHFYLCFLLVISGFNSQIYVLLLFFYFGHSNKEVCGIKAPISYPETTLQDQAFTILTTFI
jgi:hypothetical protein